MGKPQDYLDPGWREASEVAVSKQKPKPQKWFRPRHEFFQEPEAVKERERDHVCSMIAASHIEFSENSSELTPKALSSLEQLSDALKEYPELDVKLEGYAGQVDAVDDHDTGRLQRLSSERAQAVRAQLLKLGAPCIWEWRGIGFYESLLLGKVKVIPSERCTLLHSPQTRLDYVLNRIGFEFVPKEAKLASEGSVVIDICARVLKETEDRLIIHIPERCSKLAAHRAEAIKLYLLQKGVQNEIVVKPGEATGSSTSEGSAAFLQLEAVEGLKAMEDAVEDGPPKSAPLPVLAVVPRARPDYSNKEIPIMKAQQRLSEILLTTPLSFKRDKTDIVADCLPILQQCSAVLRNAQCIACRVEVYSGLIPDAAKLLVGDNNDPHLVLARSRASKLVERLRDQGVTDIRLHPIGYNYQKYGGASQGALPGPHADFILVDADDEEEILLPPEFMEARAGDDGCVNKSCVACIPMKAY